MRIEGQRVETCPISGTAQRTGDPMRDADNIKELLKSAKEESELTMCTDVDRNDKSRVCEPGTVKSRTSIDSGLAGGAAAAPLADAVGAEVDEEGKDDDEPLEADDAVGGAPHDGVGEGRPGEQEEAEEGHEPALEGAAQEVAEDPDAEQRKSRREKGE